MLTDAGASPVGNSMITSVLEDPGPTTTTEPVLSTLGTLGTFWM